LACMFNIQYLQLRTQSTPRYQQHLLIILATRSDLEILCMQGFVEMSGTICL
jgi:hypothetical protein